MATRRQRVAHRKLMAALEAKRLRYAKEMAGDDAEHQALLRLSLGQLIARKHGTPPTLPLTEDAVDRLNGTEDQT